MDTPHEFFVQLGEVINATKANTEAISKLVEATGELVAQHREMSGEFRDLKTGLLKLNQELAEVRSAISLDQDSRKDFQYLRRAREEAGERRPVVRGVMIAVLSAALVGALGWMGNAMYSKASTEIRGTK